MNKNKNIMQRAKAAVDAFRMKSAGSSQSMSLNQLLAWLGIERGLSSEALSEATYFACCKVLSEGIGKLPFKIQQYNEDQGIRVAREHQYFRMLHTRPNRYMTASTFWSTLELCRNHFGNGYAWIDTRDPKKPQLWPMDPRKVTVYYDNARRLSDVPDVYYQYSGEAGVVVLGSEEVLHVKSHHTIDGLVGVSVREQLRETIGGNVRAQKMVNEMYDSGMTAKSVLQYTGGLNDANVQVLKEQIENYMLGKSTGKGAVIPIPYGFTLTPLNMKLADSQFLEIKQYSALQIASAFGVKPYQVGDYTKSSYSSAEAQQLSFLVDTLLVIVKQYEEEIGYKLLSDEEEANGYHVKLNTAVMLRTDQKTLIEALALAVQSFLYTPNEAREFLDKPAVEGGDKLLGNGASIPVQYTGAQYINLEREEEKAWLRKTIEEILKASA